MAVCPLTMGDHVIDDAVCLCLFGRHEVVPLGILTHALDRLTGVLGDDLVQPLTQIEHFPRMDLDVGGLSLVATGDLVDQNACVGQRKRLPFAPPASSSAPMLMALPTQIVLTSALMNCIVS